MMIWVMDHASVRFRLILSNGEIFKFGDYLQRGLPDLRDEFIKRQRPSWYFDLIQFIWRLLKPRGCIEQCAGFLPRSGALRKFPEESGC